MLMTVEAGGTPKICKAVAPGTPNFSGNNIANINALPAALPASGSSLTCGYPLAAARKEASVAVCTHAGKFGQQFKVSVSSTIRLLKTDDSHLRGKGNGMIERPVSSGTELQPGQQYKAPRRRPRCQPLALGAPTLRKHAMHEQVTQLTMQKIGESTR